MRIFQYSNPFEVHKIIKSKSLEHALHLTVSQTLLNGFKNLENCGDNYRTLDSYLKEQFPKWHGDSRINNSVKKLSLVNDAIKQIEDQDIIKSFQNNRSNIIKTLESLVELEIKPYDLLELSESDKTLICFYKLYEKIAKEQYWKIDDFVKPKYDTIVFHSVHQFSSLITYFIKQLTRNGINVVFMFNYNKKFENIYKTWDRVYNCLNIPQVDILYFESETKLKKSGVGTNIGHYMNGELFEIKEYENLNIQRYSTLTDFTREVESVYADAISNVPTNSENISPMVYMKSQFYSVNGEDANKLLKVVFPEQFKERHFLAYPIGKLFLGIYNLWDEDAGEIRMNSQIKDVLSYDIWGNNPIRFFNAFEQYLRQDLLINEYINEVNSLVNALTDLNCYYKDFKNRSLKVPGERYKLILELKRFPFLSIKLKDVEKYIDVIKDINRISKEAFDNSGQKINVKNHFLKLITGIISRRSLNNIERELVDGVMATVNMLENDMYAGDVKELQEALHLFLNESKENPVNSLSWIVRDLEQLDGEVLYVDKLNDGIHISQLSNEIIEKRVKQKEIWPLDHIIEKLSIDDSFKQLYYVSKQEYKSFLLYMVFYGSYYYKKNIRFSFDKLQNQQENHVLDVFKYIGFKELPSVTEKNMTFIDFNRNATTKSSYCPYRRDFDIVNRTNGNKKEIYHDLIQQYRVFKNIFAFLIIEELIILYFDKNLLSFDKNYLDTKINKLTINLKSQFYKYFSCWGKTKIDELIEESLELYLPRSLNYVKKISTAVDENHKKNILKKHQDFVETRMRQLIYNPLNASEIDDKINDDETKSFLWFYPDANIRMCQNCVYRQDCLVDYVEQ